MLEDEAPHVQLWVRTEKGKVYGPLAPTSAELLIDNGVVTGRVQVSTDGYNYVFPGRLPGVRMHFPRALWGEVVEPGDELDRQWSVVVAPPSLAEPSSRVPGAAPGGPVPGPPVRAPGGPVTAGPGARSQATQRPAPRAPAQPPAPRNPAAPQPTTAPSSSDALFAGLDLPPPPATSPSSVQTASTASGVRSSPSGSRPQPPPHAAKAMVELPSSGTLDRLSSRRLYGMCAQNDANVLVTLQLADRAIQVHFKKGAPEFLDSTHADDSLQSFLMARNLATPQQLGLAEAKKARFGGELLPALFGLGLINPGTAFQQLSERAASILFRALMAEAGSFTLQAVELSPARAMPLGNKWGVYLEQLRRAPIGEVRRRVLEAMDLPVMRSGGGIDAADLKLLPQEARALTFFDGVRSLSQIARDSPGDADVLVRTAWMLHELDLVAYGEAPIGSAGTPAPMNPQVPRGVPGPPPGIVRPAAGVPGPPPGIPGPPPAVAAVAGPPRVPPAGPPPGISAPPAAVAAVAGPQRVPPAGPPGVPGPPPGIAHKSTVPYPAKKPDSVEVKPPPVVRPPAPPPVAQARPATPTISAPSVRAPVAAAAAPADSKQVLELLEKMKSQNFFELFSLTKQADASAIKGAYFKLAKSYHPDTVPAGTPEVIAKAKADIFALIGQANRTLSDANLRAEYVAELEAGGTGEKVDIASLLQGEEFFQKGRILVKARKFPEAVKVLDEAIKTNANEGEYYGWRGYSKFFLHQDKARGFADAMKDIEFGLRLNPNAASVHYFVGFIWKLMGDANKAQAAFKKCVELDPRFVDAQRELRMAK